MSSDFDDDFDGDFEDEEEGGPVGETFEEMLRRLAASGNLTTRHADDDGEEGESREISVEEFYSQMSGVSRSDNDDDDEYDDDDEDEDDEDGQQFSIGFGMGSDGSVTPVHDNGSGGFSFSFTVDEDGEEVPDIRCPKCGKIDPDILDWENDIYRCTSCRHKFVPEIYEVLDSAEEYLDRSWYNFQHRNFKRAIRDANAAINLEPNNCKAHLSRGKALVEREELEQAESDFSEAIRISPDYDVAFFERGKTRMYLQKFDEAIADFTMSIGFDPDFAETYRLRAVGYLQQERYEDAIRDLTEALKRDPNEAQAWFERGYNYSLLDEHQKAVQDYSEALRRDSGHRDSYARRAESYEKLERYQDAITDYKSFLRTIGKGSTSEEISGRITALQRKLDPNAEPVTFDPDEEVSIWEDVTLTQERKQDRSQDHGEELLEEGDLDGAYKEFSAYIKNVPNRMLPYIYRACVSLKAGKLEEAIKDLTSAAECPFEIIPHVTPFSEGTDPHYKNIYLLRAFVYTLLGKHEEVQRDLVNHLRFISEKSYLGGTWSRRLMNLTAVEALSGVFVGAVANRSEKTRTPLQNSILALIEDDRESAQKAIKKAIKSDPKNPVNYWTRGLAQDEAEEVFKDFATAIELAGGKAEHYFVQGFKMLLNNRTREGHEGMLKAISMDPNNAEYHEKLGVFLSKANQHDEAIQHLTKAIEFNPDSKDAYFTRGVSLDWKGQTEVALADLEQAIALESKPGYLKTEAALEKIQEIRESESKKQALLSKWDSPSEKLVSASEYIKRGEVYLKEAKWEQAYADFYQAIQLEPENADAYRHRGATFYKLGDAKSALKDYNQAIALDPKNSDLFLNRGILQADGGDSANALSDFNEAIRLNPNNAMAYHMRARVHSEAWYDGDSIDRAIEDFEKAIELNPNDPEVYVSRAEFWGQPCFRGAEKDALADLDQAIRLAPDNARYYLASFKVKAKLNDATGASEDLTKAYQLDPTNEEVRVLVQKLTSGSDKAQAAIFAQSGLDKYKGEDYEGCIHDMSEAIKNDPSTEVYFSLRGLAHNQLDMEDEALSDFSEAINLDTKNDEIFVKRGIIYAERDLLDEALGDFNKAISLGSKEPIVFLRRGFLYLEKELIDEAINDFTKSIELDPSLMSYVARGNAYMQQKSYDLAISDLSRAIELDPAYDNAYLQRGFAYQQLEDYKFATEDYEVYLRITEDDDFREEITELIKEWKEKEALKSSQKMEDVIVENKLDPTPNDIQQTSPETLKPPLSITETWMQMGKAALEKGLYPDAVLNFDKVVKKEPNNWEATIYYWRAIGGQTDFENEAWDIFFENINQIKSYILNRLTSNERKAALMLIAESVHWYTDLYMNLVKEHRDERVYSLENQDDLLAVMEVWNLIIRGINRFEYSLNFLEALEGSEADTLKLQLSKSKMNWITTLCEPTRFISKAARDGSGYAGLPDENRPEYIAMYDALMDEIVKVEPDYKPEKLIDRLHNPTCVKEELERPAVLARMQAEVDKARQQRLADYEKQKYWETHPEEYAAYLEEEKRKKEEEKARVLAEEQRNAEARKARALAEQKRKQELFEERKQKLQKEIDEHNLKLEVLKHETGSEIERLRKERDSLGFLAMGKKKEIDQKIHSLENQFLDFATKAEALKKQLKDLKP